jgi:hypothetical protein
MPPARRFSAATTLDDAYALRDLPVDDASFELCCADVHPYGCTERLQARRLSDLVEIAREHGASAHGFTPVWYSQQRLASMAALAARSDG